MLDNGTLKVTDYDTWGRYGGVIERGFGTDWKQREKFWRNLSQAVARAEARANAQTHKGLLYFKIGAMSLACGRSFPVSVRWFRMAFEEDTRLYSNPWQQSAYRMMVIVKAFDRFCRAIRDPNVRREISAIVTSNRDRIGRFIGGIYDRTVIDSPLLRRVERREFLGIIGDTSYKVLPMQSYRAAEWLCRHKDQINLTILPRYGLAQAAVVLCGTTIEGILLSRKTVRRRIRLQKKRKKRPDYTLGSLIFSYIAGLRGAPELTAALIFIWFARNLIHPHAARRIRDDIIDMEFADFTLTLTAYVIQQVAKRARRG